VTIEFPSEYALWHKRADILVGFDKSTDFKIGTDESLSFLLGAKHLKKGYLTIQPIVYQDTSVVKFEHVKYSVRTSLNVLENDTSVTTSVALVLQGEIEDLQETKVDKVIGKGLSSNDFTDVLKSKLDGIEEGAEVNTVTSVATRTGDVVLTKSDVGLSNVDNTSDVDKPISTATQTALNDKAPLIHTHTIAQVDNLQTILDAKANKVQENWITPTLISGWVGNARYKKDNMGVVWIECDINNGTAISIASLPAGYRPLVDTQFFPILVGASTNGFAFVNSSGGFRILSTTYYNQQLRINFSYRTD
jgi:hypothetical protein